MDPISAAGIGLGITSLVFQAFGGCIKGYQIFIEADDMPERFQYFRVRLRIEQTRLLSWGEKVGLLEHILDAPSRGLRLRHNLAIDLLLEMQALFKECAQVSEPFDKMVQPRSLNSTEEDDRFTRRFPKGTNRMIMKVFSALEKTPQAQKRLQWAVISQERLERLIEKLIGLNDSIENLLDKSEIDELREMQRQTYMAILQLNNKVEQLNELSQALQIKSTDREARALLPTDDAEANSSGIEESANFASLASFKAQQIQVETLGRVQPLITSDLVLHVDATPGTARSLASYRGVSVWVEWREYEADLNPQSEWNHTVRDRVEQLVALLQIDNKPANFRTPTCLGFFEDDNDEVDRFGFVYEVPSSKEPSVLPTSLFELFDIAERPSLTDRVGLARIVSECLMYLHSVDWLHKGFRSDNIVFPNTGDGSIDYESLVVAGFEYARPDLPDAATETVRHRTSYDIYRHPDSLYDSHSGSRKSYDIYGLGVMLVEIACWKSIDKVLQISLDQLNGISELLKVRERLLSKVNLDMVSAHAGSRYREVVRKCLIGGKDLGISPRANESDPVIGAAIQAAFSQHVVRELNFLCV